MSLGRESAIVSLNAQGYLSGLTSMQTRTDSTLRGVANRFSVLKTSVQSSLTPLKGTMSGVSSLLAGGAAGGIAGVAAMLVVDRLRSMVESSMTLIETQRQLQRQFRLTAESAAGLRVLGEQVGINPQEMIQHLQEISRRRGEMLQALDRGDTGGAAFTVLQRLRLEAGAWLRMPVEDAIMTLGDRLQDIVDPGDRAAASFAVLGERARALEAFMERGSAGLQRARDTARDAGTAIDGTSSSLHNLAREWEASKAALTETFRGMGLELSGTLLPLLQNLTAELNAVRRAILELRAGSPGSGVASVASMFTLAPSPGSIFRRLQGQEPATPNPGSTLRRLQGQDAAAPNPGSTLRRLQGQEPTAPRGTPAPRATLTPAQQAAARVHEQFGLEGLDHDQMSGLRALTEEWERLGSAATRASLQQLGARRGQLQFADRALARLDQARQQIESGRLDPDVNSMITGLRRQAATWGMNTAEIARFDLAARGASQSQLRAIDQEIAGLGRLANIRQQLARDEQEVARVRAAVQATRTPTETLQEEIRRIREMGLNRQQQATTLAAMFQQRYQQLGLGERQLPGLLEFGSVEAVSAMNQAGANRQVSLLEQMLAVFQDATRRTAEGVEVQRDMRAIMQRGGPIDDFLDGR